MPVLACDFDGVLCDSVEETALTAWRAGAALWADMAARDPHPELLAEYRRARPAVETGYEAILVMRLLSDGEAAEAVLRTFAERAPGLMARSGLDAAGLKALFGKTRDRWLARSPAEWSALSPLYPGVAEWLKGLPEDVSFYIVTTKERRFVERLLAGRDVRLPPGRIFGLEEGRPKESVLLELAELHRGETVCFVEDRLATLERCLARPELRCLHLRLAGWGYNTEAERTQARQLAIPVWERADLFRFFRSESDFEQ